MPHWELLLLFFTIAAVYASAGFGGGSSYLAVMALFAIPMQTMRSTSLMCNIVVVLGGTYILWKSGYLNFKKILPLSIASIPMTFLGGMMPLKEHTFFVLLGFSLIIAALLMFFQQYLKSEEPEQQLSKSLKLLESYDNDGMLQNFKGLKPLKSSAIGGIIGFFSGMVGIGGGIFLSPILNLMKWDTPKNIAATASFFILVNSISGLVGQLIQNKFTLDWQFALPLMFAVLLGGQLGSRFSNIKLNQAWVRQITAALVFYAGVNFMDTFVKKSLVASCQFLVVSFGRN
jgi:uncharacterized protein